MQAALQENPVTPWPPSGLKVRGRLRVKRELAGLPVCSEASSICTMRGHGQPNQCKTQGRQERNFGVESLSCSRQWRRGERKVGGILDESYMKSFQKMLMNLSSAGVCFDRGYKKRKVHTCLMARSMIIMKCQVDSVYLVGVRRL